MKKTFLILAFTLLSSAASAEVISNTAQPVEISAAKSLEWNRKEKTYTAREKVKVVQGAILMQSDLLTARYTDENGMTNISTLEAKNNITIQSPPYTAYGDTAVYDVRTGKATMTGKDLKITTDADMLTAKDKIEFFGTENRLVASGNATATRGGDTVTADVLSAHFDKDAAGKMGLEKITATGNVTIKTEKETLTGDQGVYNVPAQKAVLTGKVRISQGKNWLEGTRADVDMATGISQLLSNGKANSESRVKGVFYPSELKQTDKSR